MDRLFQTFRYNGQFFANSHSRPSVSKGPWNIHFILTRPTLVQNRLKQLNQQYALQIIILI